MTRVVNIPTGEEHFYDCSPEKAVVMAHYQHELNIWDKEEYDYSLVEETPYYYKCGNMGCHKF